MPEEPTVDPDGAEAPPPAEVEPEVSGDAFDQAVAAADDGSDGGPDDKPAFDIDQFSDEKVTVKVSGEEQEVTVGELKKGFMLQRDYTQKTQELSEQRTLAERYAALDEALQADPEKTLRQLAVGYEVELGASTPSGQEEVDDGFDDLDPLEREIAELKAQLSEVVETTQQSAAEREQAALQAQLDAEFEAIKTEHNDEDLQFAELVNFAVDNQIGQLDVAYEVMSNRKAASRATTENEGPSQEAGEPEVDKRRAAKRSAPPVEGGATKVNAGPALGATPTLEEALAAAESEHGIHL